MTKTKKDITNLVATLEQNQLILREIGLRYGVSSGNLAVQPTLEGAKSISCPQDIVDRCSAEMSDYLQEHLRVFLLSTKNVVMEEITVYIGNTNSSVIRPAEVFRPAIIANAPNVILCHNHPSGDPTPSIQDTEITKELVSAGKLLGINVQDHIVIGAGGRYTSMNERLLGFP